MSNEFGSPNSPEGTPRTEGRTIYWKSPQELINDNPAAEIFNEAVVNNIVQYFNPTEWVAIKGVRVRSYSSEKQAYETKLFVKDGNNRTFAARALNAMGATYKIPDELRSELLPTENFSHVPIEDITDSQFDRYGLDRREYDENGNPVLTIDQYWGLVVDPIIKHGEIKDKRAAALFISGWKDMVGEEASEQFSTPAALQLIAQTFVTDERFRRFLEEQGPFVLNETVQDRNRIINGLVQTRKIIQDLKLNPKQVAEASFYLIASESAAIGGSESTNREIYRLLQNQLVMNKLAISFLEPPQIEQHKTELGLNMIRAVRKIKDKDVRAEALQTMYEAVTDSNLSYQQTITIINADSPIQQYDQEIREVHRSVVEQTYRRQRGKKELTPAETSMIRNIGGQRYLNKTDLDRMISVVGDAQLIFEQMDTSLARWSQDREALIAMGVREETLRELRSELESMRETALTSSSHNALRGRIKDLQDRIIKGNQAINTQQNIFIINNAVVAIYANTPTYNFGRTDIISHTLDLIEKRRLSNEGTAVYIKNLHSLDSDLQQSVVLGYFSYETAVTRQEKRRAQTQKLETIQRTEDIIKPPETTTLSTGAVEAKSTIDPTTDDKIIQQATPEVTAISRANQITDEDRKQETNESLTRAIQSLNALLDTKNVSRENMTLYAREIMKLTGNRLFQILFDEENLNAERIIFDYLQHIKTRNQELEIRVQEDMTQIEQGKENTKV